MNRECWTAVYVDASSTSQGAVYELVCSFFGGFGETIDVALEELDSSNWANEGLVGVIVLGADRTETGDWICIVDTAPGDREARREGAPWGFSEGWVEALAKKCFEDLGADAFWYFESGAGTCGWFSKRARRKPSGLDAARKLVQTFPLPFVSAKTLTARNRAEARHAVFRIDRAAFGHFLEFGPRMHPPRPNRATLTPLSGSRLTLEWSPSAKKKVRPFRGDGPKLAAPTTERLTHVFGSALAHHERRLEMFPDVRFEESGVQGRVLETWKGHRSFAEGAESEYHAACFLMTSRAARESAQGDEKTFVATIGLLVDALVATFGLAGAIDVLAAVWALEVEDEARATSGQTTPWWIPGWAFPPFGVSIEVWFRLREWLSRASAEEYAAALERARSLADEELQCAAAMAFPAESLWQPHVHTFLARIEGAGTKPYAQRVRLTSLAACPVLREDAELLFAARPDVGNTYEYPTLVRALGVDAFALIAAQRPTDPKAMESRLLALSLFVGPDAARAIHETKIPSKNAQKVKDEYLRRNPDAAR